jgi:4-amino-4-deoxy-L-arabinose transferase-like glycosyltransferase
METVLIPGAQYNSFDVDHAAVPSHRVYFLPIIGLALLLRLVMALAIAKGDADLWFYNQASELGCLAHSINTGQGLASPFCGATGPSAFLAPGYPLLVAAVFRLFGEFSPASTAVLVAIQLFFGLLIVLVLMSLSRRLFDGRVANIAGILCAISPTMIWLPVLFWETSLSVFFLTSAFLVALQCLEKPKRWNWAAMGLLFGLAMLVNPALTTTLAAVFAWTIWQSAKARIPRTRPMLTALVWIVTFIPWPIRNELVLHTFIPLRSNLGYELWQGNRPGSDGGFAPELHLNVNRVERSHYAQVGEVGYMREKSELAVAAIETGPAHFLSLSLRRFVRFWIGVTPRKNSAIVIATLCLTTAFAAAGLFLLSRSRPAYAILLSLPFIVLPLPYYITHADFRFRLLLDPIAMMLGTYAVQWWYRKRSKLRTCKAIAVTTAA